MNLHFNPQPKTKSKKKPSAVEVWERGKKKIVKPEFEKRGINYCEVCKWLHDRGKITDEEVRANQIFLGFAHRHKRVWYKSRPELLFSFNQILMACQKHHFDFLEWDRESAENWFLRLRGEDDN